MHKRKTEVKTPDELPKDWGKVEEGTCAAYSPDYRPDEHHDVPIEDTVPGVPNTPAVEEPNEDPTLVAEKAFRRGFVEGQMHPYPDGVPYREPDVLEHTMHSGRGSVYRELLIRETTNDQAWRNRNLDLSEFGNRLKQALALMAIGVVMMVVVVLIGMLE